MQNDTPRTLTLPVEQVRVEPRTVTIQVEQVEAQEPRVVRVLRDEAEHIRYTTAHHEAGHVAACFAAGLPVTGASIEPDNDSHGRYWCPSPHMIEGEGARGRRRAARAIIVACYAGLAAERLVDPAAPDYHAEGDEEQAFDISRRYGVFPRYMSHVGDDDHHRYLGGLRREAARLVRLERVRIGRLAAALLEAGRLDGEALWACWTGSGLHSAGGAV